MGFGAWRRQLLWDHTVCRLRGHDWSATVAVKGLVAQGTATAFLQPSVLYRCRRCGDAKWLDLLGQKP